MTIIRSPKPFSFELNSEQWIAIGRHYCQPFETAMVAAAACEIERTIERIKGYDRDVSKTERRRERIRRKILWIENRKDRKSWKSELTRFKEREVALTRLIDKDRRYAGDLDSADCRVAAALGALDEKRPVEAYEDDGEERTLKRRLADLESEQKERDRISEEARIAAEKARHYSNAFHRLVKQPAVVLFAKKNAISDLRSWSQLGRRWREKISFMIDLHNQRSNALQLTIVHRWKSSIRTTLAEFENPDDPTMRSFARGDLLNMSGVSAERFQAMLNAMRAIAISTVDAEETEPVQAVPWDLLALEVRRWANDRGLPDTVKNGRLKTGSYSPFVQFLALILAQLPSHLRGSHFPEDDEAAIALRNGSDEQILDIFARSDFTCLARAIYGAEKRVQTALKKAAKETSTKP